LGAQLQEKYNQSRRTKLRSGLNVRPVFLPLQFVMTALGTTVPYRSTTQALSYDVVIIGLKTDVQNRDIIIERLEESKPVVYVGEQSSLYLRSDDIAGLTADTGGGQLGVFYLPSPMVLPAGARLSVKMFKTDATAGTETDNICFIGIRVFNKAYGDAIYDGDEQRRVEEWIAATECPRVEFLKAQINFATAGVGGLARNILFPQVDHPLLVRGLRTTLRQSQIEGFRIQGEANWMPSAVPVWGVCGEDEQVHENYQWFPRPIYLRSKNQIEIERVTNSIEGTLIDAQTGNTITAICETP
jgi:hypothetical protein